MRVTAVEARRTEQRAPYVEEEKTAERQTPLTSRMVRWTLSFNRVVPR